jgi:hypothetical protein
MALHVKNVPIAPSSKMMKRRPFAQVDLSVPFDADMTFANSIFTTLLDFGSQRQPLEVIVDTGSSWVWAYADDCNPETQTCPNNNIFHTGGSLTFSPTTEAHKIAYGSMEV